MEYFSVLAIVVAAEDDTPYVTSSRHLTISDVYGTPLRRLDPSRTRTTARLSAVLSISDAFGMLRKH
jgi:hypothetical protein